MLDVALEPFEGLGFAFRRDLYPPVGEVLHPPVQTLTNSRCPGEVPEAHALDASADEVMPRETHDEESMDYIMTPVSQWFVRVRMDLDPHSLIPRRPVLIVEDDADLREMMAQLLTLEGFDAEAVANGRDALDYLKRVDPPDLILLDLMMPVMDGWEFRRLQREDPAIAKVPVVVLSALDDKRALELEGTAFLKKPLDFDHLLELVRRYCRHAH